jgi:hypothetical protein
MVKTLLTTVCANGHIYDFTENRFFVFTGSLPWLTASGRMPATGEISMLKRFGVVAIIAACVVGCSEKPEKVWIVVDLLGADGRPAQMSFDNPAVPDMTLTDCEGALASAVPTLMQGIESRPETKGSQYVSAKCVQSAEDPIKPKV